MAGGSEGSVVITTRRSGLIRRPGAVEAVIAVMAVVALIAVAAVLAAPIATAAATSWARTIVSDWLRVAAIAVAACTGAAGTGAGAAAVRVPLRRTVARVAVTAVTRAIVNMTTRRRRGWIERMRA